MLARQFVGAAALTAVIAATGLVGCAAPSDVALHGERDDDGSLRGELKVYVSDDFEGNTETTYCVATDDGQEQRLLFDGGAARGDLLPSSRIKVWVQPVGRTCGSCLPDAGRPVEDGLASARSALIGGAPYPARSFAFVLIDLGGGVNRTAADITARLMTGARLDPQLLPVRVVRPAGHHGAGLRADHLRSACANVSASGVRDGHSQCLTPMIRRAPSSTTSGTSAATCRPAAGAGSRRWARRIAPSRDTWYNASTSCVVLVQEPGHNFGMQHSSSLRCRAASFADDPNGCTASEYGDPFDPMGGGCRHMNAWQKAYQGWFGGCNGVRVTDSGTFTLLPLEPACNGVQFLQIKTPKARTFNRPAAGGGGPRRRTLDYYYVELRAPHDFDGTLGNTLGAHAHGAGPRRRPTCAPAPRPGFTRFCST